MSDFAQALAQQVAEMEVTVLCERHGASKVIDCARRFIERTERKASEERQRWRAELMRAPASGSQESGSTECKESSPLSPASKGIDHE